MLIRLAEIIEDEPLAWSDDHAPGADALEDMGISSLGGLSWGGRVSRTLSGHLFSARLRYAQTLTCQRCLEPVELPVDTEIVLVVEPRRGEPTTGEVELDEGDLDVLYVEDGILDTEPVLLEQLELNIPMAILCREDCKGLCPECGAALNSENCECVRASVDPRWSALEGLRNKD